MFPDFKELLSEFNAHNVKYLIVGGYAVSLHAQPRATKDLDIVIRADPENGRAVYAALAKFGAPVRMFPEPGRVERIEIDMTATGVRFLPGHRIRAEIASSRTTRETSWIALTVRVAVQHAGNNRVVPVAGCCRSLMHVARARYDARPAAQ